MRSRYAAACSSASGSRAEIQRDPLADRLIQVRHPGPQKRHRVVQRDHVQLHHLAELAEAAPAGGDDHMPAALGRERAAGQPRLDVLDRRPRCRRSAASPAPRAAQSWICACSRLRRQRIGRHEPSRAASAVN